MTVVAIVLAGGEGRRLGGADKALLDLGRRTVLAHLLARLTPQVSCVAISANGDLARFTPYGLPVLPDGDFMGQGPLAGLLAGLDWAAGQGADVLLSVPCDTPFIPSNLVARLVPAPSCAASSGRTHHLVAFWPVEARGRLRLLLEQPGPRDVGKFAASLGARTVAFSPLPWDAFLNINTPGAARRAARIARNGEDMA
ncbi:MAG: molybdenum cofactor guanylyltransferase [Acetobacteraceae bacterium]|nr:molybdenum cofactor guanylyltransferase [Acetobacteraceae bacterium]